MSKTHQIAITAKKAPDSFDHVEIKRGEYELPSDAAREMAEYIVEHGLSEWGAKLEDLERPHTHFPPNTYETAAAKAEKDEAWEQAAVLWMRAAAASIGHKRADSYEREAAKCRRNAGLK